MLIQNCRLIKGQLKNDLCISDIREQKEGGSDQYRAFKLTRESQRKTTAYKFYKFIPEFGQKLWRINLIMKEKKKTSSLILTAICF